MTHDEAFHILRSLPQHWGTSEAEVQHVESKLGVRFPKALRELMLRTGSDVHMKWLFPDEEIATLNKLTKLRDVAEEILAGDAPALRPAFPFVTLSQSQGCAFTFVRADGLNDDPDMMCYEEGHGFRLCAGRMSIGQYIAAAVQRSLSRSPRPRA